MPFNRPSPADIRDRVAADIETSLPGADARLRRTVEGVLTRVMAIASHELHGHLDWIARQVLVDTADDELVDRHATIWGLGRRAATTATGAVVLTGAEDAPVPEGTVLRRADGRLYATDAAAVVGGDGSVVVPVTAAAAGAAGAAAAGTRLALVAPVAGVVGTAVVAAPGLAGGADAEDDASLRARVLDRIRLPPHGGARHDYRAWALEVPGVTRVWVYPLWMGLGTVGVAIAADDDPAGPLPPPALVEDVQAHIDEVRPVTADVFVFAPAALPVDLTVRIIPDTPAIRAAVSAEVTDFIRREAEPGGTLKLSRLREAISLGAGEFAHDLTSPVADIIAPAGALPVPGVITWLA